MRKRNKGRMLSRPKSQREALLKSLVTNLFLYEKITTTEAKAKELRILAEKCITRAKNESVANKRLLSGLFAKEVSKKLFDEIAPQYKDRPGGYTRIIKVNARKSDGARMAIVELVK